MARLTATPAGKIVLAAIEAHGGLRAWYQQGAIRFRYDYQPVSGGVRRNSLQTVDVLSARAYHFMTHPAVGKIAFDGERAWRKLEGGAEFAARFWALTPYYFVGMPFVLSDSGVRLELSDERPEAAGLSDAHVIKVSFAPGTGDAPNDYYILYISKSNSRVIALRYVVSFAPFFKEKGIKHTPEKLLVYEDYEPASGLSISRRHVFYDFSSGSRGAKVTESTISEVEAGVSFDEAALQMPPDAELDRSLDKP